MNKKITIAIDGYSSTGKSTIAKQLAQHLGYIYVDSGAMYRAITLFAMRKDFISESGFDIQTLVDHLPQVSIDFQINPKNGRGEVHLNGDNVESFIRSMEVSNLVSKVSTVPEVRTKLVAEQHKMGQHKGIVMDGRDIGTVVFPDAELKLFMTSSAETRAQRRYQELLSKGDNVSFQEVLKNVTERDQLDTTRAISPLKKAEDAIEIDNSELSKEEQFSQILKLVQKQLT